MTAGRPLVHFVWTGRSFPYYCRLAVESALARAPDASIVLHVFGEHPVGRHVRSLSDRPRVAVQPVDLDRLFGEGPHRRSEFLDLLSRLRAPGARSNLIRLAVLHQHGGVYLDTDTVVTRPLDDPDDVGAYVGAEVVWRHNRARVTGETGPAMRLETTVWAADWTIRRLDSRLGGGRCGLARRPPTPHRSREQVNNAVIGARAGDPFLRECLTGALDLDPSLRFALGPHLLDEIARRHPELVHVAPPSRFYSVPSSQSYRFFEDPQLELDADASVIHYVASNHRRLLSRLDEHDSRFRSHPALFWRLARQTRTAMRSRPIAVHLGAR